MCVYIGFKTAFYVVRQLDSTASYLPTGLHLGFFRLWPSLYSSPSFSPVFLVLYISTVLLYIHSRHIMAKCFDRKTVIFRSIANIFKVQQISTQWDPISYPHCCTVHFVESL